MWISQVSILILLVRVIRCDSSFRCKWELSDYIGYLVFHLLRHSIRYRPLWHHSILNTLESLDNRLLYRLRFGLRLTGWLGSLLLNRDHTSLWIIIFRLNHDFSCRLLLLLSLLLAKRWGARRWFVLWCAAVVHRWVLRPLHMLLGEPIRNIHNFHFLAWLLQGLLQVRMRRRLRILGYRVRRLIFVRSFVSQGDSLRTRVVRPDLCLRHGLRTVRPIRFKKLILLWILLHYQLSGGVTVRLIFCALAARASLLVVARVAG